MVHTVVLVEGRSDAAALEALGMPSGVRVVAMGGVTNFARYLGELSSPGLRLAGLCDVGEQRFMVHALLRAGMSEDGFFVCVDDLEDELLRSVGTVGVLKVLESHGDLAKFRTFQAQPAKRNVAIEAQLHRFLGTTSGRKEKYARLLTEALDPLRIPAPLASLLEFVG